MKSIMITLNQIKAHEPCKYGWSKVFKANGGVNADMDAACAAQKQKLKEILDTGEF